MTWFCRSCVFFLFNRNEEEDSCFVCVCTNAFAAQHVLITSETRLFTHDFVS